VLRQLAALTRRVPAAGPKALAVAVYTDGGGRHIQAQENGIEGVACVDDAARAASLLCRLWARTGNEGLRAWAEGLLDFVLWMHQGQGLWFNFIYDWEGDRNAQGITSRPGVNFWQARATCAMSDAALLLGHGPARKALDEALDAAATVAAPPDVRALHALAALDVLRKSPDQALSRRLLTWCEAIASCRSGDMLMNSPDERGHPHLWGHLQEAVLADAGELLGREDLRQIAADSADAVFVAVIESSFELPQVLAYDVQSAVFVMDRLAAVSGDARYLGLAESARAWFDGRNPAGAATYDRVVGRVADGIDHGRISRNSGAEANIAAGIALLDDPMVLSIAKSWSEIPPA
jgi:hypothetical protein